MLTKTDVVNLALGKLGQTVSVINADTETTTYAKIARRHFTMSVTALLLKHPWSIYTKTAELSLVSLDPSIKWQYAYSMPTDAAQIRRIATDSYFSIEEEYADQRIPYEAVYTTSGYDIHTVIPNAWAEYTVRPPENGPYMDHFARALAAMLAMDMAPSIITNNYIKMKDVFLKEARNEISEQIALDISLRPEPPVSYSPFLRARWQS